MIIAFNSLKKNIFPATVGKIGNDGNFLVYLRLSRNFVGFYHNFSMENFLCDSFFYLPAVDVIVYCGDFT